MHSLFLTVLLHGFPAADSPIIFIGKLGFFITHFIGYHLPGPARKFALFVTSLILR